MSSEASSALLRDMMLTGQTHAQGTPGRIPAEYVRRKSVTSEVRDLMLSGHGHGHGDAASVRMAQAQHQGIRRGSVMSESSNAARDMLFRGGFGPAQASFDLSQSGYTRRGSILSQSRSSKAKEAMKRHSISRVFSAASGGTCTLRDGGGGIVSEQHALRSHRRHAKATKPPFFRQEDAEVHAPVVKNSWESVVERLGYFPLAGLYYDSMEQEQELRQIVDDGDR